MQLCTANGAVRVSSNNSCTVRASSEPTLVAGYGLVKPMWQKAGRSDEGPLVQECCKLQELGKQ